MISKKSEMEVSAGRTILYIAIAFIIASALLLASEGSVIKNTIGGEKLFWYAAITGVIIALLLLLLFKKPITNAENSGQSIGSALIVGMFIFCPVAASFINRTLSSAPVTCSQYPLLSKSTGGSRYTEYCLFVNINGEEEKFTVSEDIYNSMAAPGQVELCTQKGVLGYEVAKAFKPAN